MKLRSLPENFDVEELLRFSRQNVWEPQYPVDIVRRFLTELVSDHRLIFDLHDARGRVACAVLLDKVKNLANDACLEIIGLRPDVDPNPVVRRLIELAIEALPKGKSGFQISLSEGSVLNGFFLQEQGFSEYYSSYEMKATPQSCEEAAFPIVRASIAHCEEVYSVLSRSFSRTPDIMIPEFGDWKKRFLASSDSNCFLYLKRQEVLGFAVLILDTENRGEVRMLGVLPQARGLGIGQSLLRHCLRKCHDLELRECLLNVAVTNETALRMYIRSGFNVVKQSKRYRMSV